MEFAIYLPKMARLPWNEKQIYQLNFRLQIWPSNLTLAMTLPLNFQGQIWNLLYLSQKWSNCHKTKSKHIDWTLSLKCDHHVWPWPWPLNFQDHVTLTFDHMHGFDQGFSWSNFEIHVAVSQNGRTDRHWTKWIGVGHSWPWQWPFGDQGQV